MFLDFISSRTTRHQDFASKEEEANSNILVAAQLSEDSKFQLEEKLRRYLLMEIAQASVILATPPALLEDNSESNRWDNAYYNEHKNVEEKLFGRHVMLILP
jgi:hypothetical protein